MEKPLVPDPSAPVTMPDGFSDYTIEVEIEDPEVEVEPEEETIPHAANLAEHIEESELARMSSELMTLFDEDERSRAEWLKTYVDGLDYLGFAQDERTEPFEGATGVFHPVLAEAVVRFQSNAIMEIFPASGPATTSMVGEETPEKVAQAKRIKEELNYQLLENMSEYRNEMEQLLFRLPLAGSVFKKVYFDQLQGRPCSNMVMADDFVVDAESTDISAVDRCCHVIRKTDNDVKKLQRAGFYRKTELGDAISYEPEAKQKEEDIKGVVKGPKNPRRVLLEFHVNYDLPEPFDSEDGIADPYVVTIDKSSGKVLSIYRNWEEQDQLKKQQQYFVHYQYMPGLGFYGFGLIHLMGSIAKAATAITRQLIDAGTFANLPGGLKTRGLRVKGDDDPIRPGEWRDVDVPGGTIGENIFPLPYKEPSGVLAQLLLNLVEEGRRIGSIADVEIGSGAGNMPVGTVLAVIERSLKVMSAVHARMHAALRRELKLITRVIADYLPENYDWDEKGQFNRRQDFDGRVDIIPVSDPNSATQTQKIVQMQAVQQLVAQAPDIYNIKEVHRASLQAIGIKNDERLLPLDQPPPRMDPLQENMAILTQQPIKVYPDQDHKAHIDAHMAAMTDPMIMAMVGQSPKAQAIQGQMEAHIAEHLAHQYRGEIQAAIGVELPPLGQPMPPDVENRIAKLVAEAGEIVRQKHQAEMAQKQAEQMAQDPVFQLREREVALKERAQQHKEKMERGEFVVDIAKAVAKEMIDHRRIESTESIAGAEIGANLVTFGIKASEEERKQGVELGKQIIDNLRDVNMTREEMERDSHERALDREAEARNSQNRTDNS